MNFDLGKSTHQHSQQNKSSSFSSSSSSAAYLSRDQNSSTKKYMQLQNIQRQNRQRAFIENRNSNSITTVNCISSFNSSLNLNEANSPYLKRSQQKMNSCSNQTCIKLKHIQHHSSIETKGQTEKSKNQVYYPLKKLDGKSILSQQCKQHPQYFPRTKLKTTQSEKYIKTTFYQKQQNLKLIKNKQQSFIDQLFESQVNTQLKDCIVIAFCILKQIINFLPFQQSNIFLPFQKRI